MKSPSMFPDDIDATTLEASWKEIGRRRARVRRIRLALKATPLVGVLAILLIFVLRQGQTARPSQAVQVLALAGGAPVPSAWSAGAPEVVSFDDGSRLELGPGTGLRVPAGAPRDPSRVDLALDTGTATFDIRPGGPRAWVIDAGEAKVRVLGTRFTVTRDGAHVHVAVERGKVCVESARIGGGMRDLTAGQDVDVVGAVVAGGPASVPVGTPVMAVESLADAPAPNALPVVQTPPSSPSSGGRAVERVALAVRPPSASAKAVATAPASASGTRAASDITATPSASPDRMGQADAARRAGRPGEAVRILTAIVDDADPRASLAAFTIGKIDADELGDLAGAASWFERAIRLGLPVGLDEDAHARLVECHGRAGRLADAARAAARYEARFPSGRHLARVERWKAE